MGVLGGAEDLVLVVAQGLNPGADVGGVLLGLVRDAALCREKDAGQFCPEFFLRVVRITEPIAFVEGRPVEAGRVAAPVREFVEGGSVVVGRGLECLLRWEMDRVVLGAVESPVVLIVGDVRAGVAQDLLAGFGDLPFLGFCGV